MSFEIPLISITVNNRENCRTVNGKTLLVEPELEEYSSSDWDTSDHEDEDDVEHEETLKSIASKKTRVWDHEAIDCAVITSKLQLFKRARLDADCTLSESSTVHTMTNSSSIQESPFVNLLNAFPREIDVSVKTGKEDLANTKDKITMIDETPINCRFKAIELNQNESMQLQCCEQKELLPVVLPTPKYLQSQTNLESQKANSIKSPSTFDAVHKPKEAPAVAIVSPIKKLQVPNGVKTLDTYVNTSISISVNSNGQREPIIVPSPEKDQEKASDLKTLKINKNTLSAWTNLGKKKINTASVAAIQENGLKSLNKELLPACTKKKRTSPVIPTFKKELRVVLTRLNLAEIDNKGSAGKQVVEQKDTQSKEKHLKISNDLIKPETTKRSSRDISEFIRPLRTPRKAKSLGASSKKESTLANSGVGSVIPTARHSLWPYKIPKRNTGSATIVKLNDIPKVIDGSLEDDLISLHPNDCLLSDLEDENGNSNKVQVPRQRSIQKIIMDKTESNKLAAVVKPLYKPTQQRSPPVVNDNVAFKSIAGKFCLQRLNKTTLFSNKPEETATSFTKEVLTARTYDEYYYLKVENICRKYDKCTNTSTCGNIHRIYHGHLVSQNLQMQEAFLNGVLEMNIPSLTQDTLKNLPIALAECNNNILLLQMIGKVLTLEIFDRTQPIKNIVDAMVSMPKLKFTYKQVVDMIFQRYGYTALLSDIIVSITVDRHLFMKHWNILEEIFVRISHQLDHYVVQKILDEFKFDYCDSTVAKAVQETLISKKLYDKTKIQIPMAYKSKLSSLSQPSISDSPSVRSEDTNCNNIPKAEAPIVNVSSTTLASIVNVSSTTLVPIVKVSSNSPVSIAKVSSDAPASIAKVSSDSPTSIAKISSTTLPFSFLECSDTGKCCMFLTENHSKLPTISIFGGFVLMFKSLNSSDYEKYALFINQVFLETIESKDDSNLMKTVIELVVNLVAFFYHWKSKHIMKTGLCFLKVLETRVQYLEDVEFYYEVNIETGLLILFKAAIMAVSFDLALAIFKSTKFKFPKKEIQLHDYMRLCHRIKYFMNTMYKANNLVLIKDLLIHIVGTKIMDIKDLGDKEWDIFEYYRIYIRSRYKTWKDISEFIFDLDDSIYEFYSHLKQNILRNVLILMYRNIKLVSFNKFLEIFESCQDFYRQSEKGVFYNYYLTMTEIHFVTHIFLYKRVLSKVIVQGETKRSYGRSYPNSPPAPEFISASFWDLHSTIRERVSYALSVFPMHIINPKESEFSEKLFKELTKFILQHDQVHNRC